MTTHASSACGGIQQKGETPDPTSKSPVRRTPLHDCIWKHGSTHKDGTNGLPGPCKRAGCDGTWDKAKDRICYMPEEEGKE